jgi:hypothetical protein
VEAGAQEPLRQETSTARSYCSAAIDEPLVQGAVCHWEFALEGQTQIDAIT